MYWFVLFAVLESLIVIHDLAPLLHCVGHTGMSPATSKAAYTRQHDELSFVSPPAKLRKMNDPDEPTQKKFKRLKNDHEDDKERLDKMAAAVKVLLEVLINASNDIYNYAFKMFFLSRCPHTYSSVLAKM
jgi:hypothetical protein